MCSRPGSTFTSPRTSTTTSAAAAAVSTDALSSCKHFGSSKAHPPTKVVRPRLLSALARARAWKAVVWHHVFVLPATESGDTCAGGLPGHGRGA